MPTRLGRAASHTKLKIGLLVALLFAANAVFWLVTWLSSRQYALLLSAGLLAYGFGLRHAVDADHIAAIDNTTRRLMQRGKRPTGVGFFFSLGHSTVVVLLCAALALGAGYLQQHLPYLKSAGALVGTLVSSLFLYLIGAINLVVLVDLFRSRRQVSKPPCRQPEPPPAGLISRLLCPLLALVSASWQMYFIGLLFGLGFDTATEVGVLALSARSGSAGMPLWAIMLLPLLFTAGMCLVDTLDGILMLGAYGWAYVMPARKRLYNLGITALSVLVAFVVGTGELLQTLTSHREARSAMARLAGAIDLDDLGWAIIGVFLLAWAGSVVLSRARAMQSA